VRGGHAADPALGPRVDDVDDAVVGERREREARDRRERALVVERRGERRARLGQQLGALLAPAHVGEVHVQEHHRRHRPGGVAQRVQVRLGPRGGRHADVGRDS
jgi:hypothetical protein